MKQLLIAILMISFTSTAAHAGAQERAMVTGAAVGATAGAAIGSQHDQTAQGAVVGAMFGAIAGAILSDMHRQPVHHVYHKPVVNKHRHVKHRYPPAYGHRDAERRYDRHHSSYGHKHGHYREHDRREFERHNRHARSHDYERRSHQMHQSRARGHYSRPDRHSSGDYRQQRRAGTSFSHGLVRSGERVTRFAAR